MLLIALPLLPLLAAPGSAQDSAAEPDPYVAFAEALEESISLWEPELLRERFDLDAVLERATAGVEVDDAFRRGFCKGVRASLDFSEQVLHNSTELDGTYHFLRMLPGAPKRALFRLAGDDGLNYHELYLEQREDGEMVIVDVYVYAMGETFSATIRRPYLATAASSNRGFIARLIGKEADYVKALPQLNEMVQKAQSDPVAAMKAYDAMPESVQRQPEILMIRIQVASLIDDEAYVEAMAAFAEHHPDSAALALLLIDFHILRGEFDRALASVDAVDELVLGDPFLDILRGGILMQADRIEEARERTLTALERDPRLEYDAWWQLMDIAIVQADHATVLALLIAFEEDYGIEWEDLTTVDAYAGFVGSPEYQEWIGRGEEQDEPG